VRKYLSKLMLALTILPLISQPVFAHVIWVIKGEKQGEYEVLYGHPEEDKPEAYDSIKFQEATAYNSYGFPQPLEVRRKYEGVTLVSPGDIAVITAVNNNGYFIVSNDDEYTNVFRPDALAANNEATEVTHTYKYTKSFFQPTGLATQPFGMKMEIVPLQDPFDVGAGGSLRVQVLFEGKPVTDVTVEYEGKEVPVNDRGIATITLTQKDIQIVEAEYRVPSTDDPATDEIAYAASLAIQKK
jgi:nickel transport protein